MRRALVLSALLLGACAGPSATSERRVATPGAELDAIARLTREIDPGELPAIWPQLPEDVRARVEIDAPHDKAPEARLAAARERLASWSLQLSTTDLAAVTPQLYRALEGVYLAEPLALAPGAAKTTLEARELLWRFYWAFINTQPMLRSFQASWVGAMPTSRPVPMAATELLATLGARMSDRLASQLLGGGAPDSVVADVLWEYAARKMAGGETKSGRAFYTEFIRRSRLSPSAAEQVRVADAYLGLEDPEAAAAALASARKAMKPDDRATEARIASVSSERETLVRLLALPADKTPETALARFDLLLKLDRPKEAEPLLAALATERPKDARVRARAVQLRVRHGEVTEQLVEALRGDDLTDRDAGYWSMRIGAAGVAIAKSAPSRRAFDEILAAGRELAKYEPGRAAALAFVVTRAAALIESKPDTASLVAALRAGLDEAVALRARYPETTDLDRIALALALFAPDPMRGLEVVLTRPKTAPLEDGELYRQRAQTALTLAAYAGKRADLGAVRRSVDEIPASADLAVEGATETLHGDLDVLYAILQGERAAFARAAAHYEKAAALPKTDRARLLNNLGFIAAARGDGGRASTLFESAGREKSDRRWVPLLDMATAPSQSKEDQLAAVRAMSGNAGAELPPLVNVWRAALETDEQEAMRAAQKALADLDGPLSMHKYALHAQGLETEGTFALGLGLRSGSLAYTFAANAFATPWLVRPAPLTRAELEVKAKGIPAKPSKSAKPSPR